MNIKEECPIDIPTSHLAKMCLIPTENYLRMYNKILISKILKNKIKVHDSTIQR
jgi:hypothetical protein